MNKLSIAASALWLASCNVETTDESSGGVDVTGDERCPAGVVAVLSDYLSTQVALLDKGGNMLSESFASSGSLAASGVAAPLSGDVAAPSNRSRSGEVVLLDRFGTNVISWIVPKTAKVRAQLPVDSGFESNPRDYLEVAADKAYVVRWGENAAPGDDPLGRGGDVVILDPTLPEITGVIDLPRDSDQPPRPTSLTPHDGLALVVLQRLALDYMSQGSSEIVAVDPETDSVAWHVVLEGLKGCGRVMLSPSGETMALACTGSIDFDGKLIDPDESGIVLLDATATPPEEIRRIAVHTELGFSPQPDLAFAAEKLVLGKTQTPLFGQGNNQLFALDLGDDSFRVLAEAAANDDGTGKGLAFGSVLCTPGCSDACLLADQDSGRIRRFSIDENLSELDAVGVGKASGLPPLNLGPF